MKTLIITTILVLVSFNLSASVVCKTPRLNKIFKIKDSKITFYNEFDTSTKREIASIVSRNKNEIKGITKIVEFENQKHIVHIDDSEHFSNANDYIIIRAKSGHEIMYPLNCEKE